MKQKFNVTGMTCSACSAHVEKSVSKLEGVSEVAVSLLTNSMTVTYNDSVTEQDIISAVEKGGYGAYLNNNKKDVITNTSNQAEDNAKKMKSNVIWSFVFLIPLFYISMGHMMGAPLPNIFHGTQNALIFAFTQFLLTIPIVFINFHYFKNGYKNLFHLAPNMDTLIAIGSSAAIIYGIAAIYIIGYGLGHDNIDLVNQYSMDLYFESGGMILTLITFGKYLEARSKGKTSEAITKLMDLTPKTAKILKDDIEEEIPVEDVVKGDIIVVRSGESIPVDGKIIEGNAVIDESAVTGESIPVEKSVGLNVIGGTINKTGYFKFEATNVGENSTLSQIIKLVEEASSSKAPISKLADKVSGIFVPVVITISIISIITWLLLGHSFSFALSIGIAVLVISCPCALGLATPTAIMVGTGKGAEKGILIKSAESLETAHKINTVVLDKTGTVTQGKPVVTDIYTFDELDVNELMLYAGSTEKLSEHPLSDAIVKKADEMNIDFLAAKEFRAIAGSGIKAIIGNDSIFAGNKKLMSENGIDISMYSDIENKLANDGKTPLYFSKNNKPLGIIAVADIIKPTSELAVEELKKRNIKVVMLTGDNKKTANAIGNRLGIENVIAEVMPQDKEKVVRNLQNEGNIVAMVGDGINDAPALTRADVGVAIGAGTDIAIESADIVLMKSSLLDFVGAIDLSKATIKNIKQNLFWAFFYNSIGIPVAAGVFYAALNFKLNPMIASAAMSLSSVFVVTNALRLKGFKTNFKEVKDNSLENKADKVNIVIGSKENIKRKEVKKMTKKIIIEGMMCAHCTGTVEKALKKMEGVQDVVVSLENKSADVTYSKEISDDEFKNVIVDAGYEVVEIK